MMWKYWDRAATCSSDFANFYSGAKLAFSGQIYSPDAEKTVQHEILGCSGVKYGQFVRLPYFAAMLWPLAQLPFPTAVVLWRLVSGASVLAFIWLWPGSRWRTLAVCAWSFPLMAAFTYGQDVPILLLAAGASIALMGRGREFEGGLCLALGAGKPHVFAMIVLLILVRRWWQVALGLGAGGALLAGTSFLTAGLSWPRVFLATVFGPGGSPNPENMINLHGLMYANHASGWIEGVTMLGLFALLLRACLRAPAPFACVLALSAGVLLGGHSYLYDLAFCIPLVLLLLGSQGIPSWLKFSGLLFASPIAYLLPARSDTANPIHYVLPLFVVAVAVAFQWHESALLETEDCARSRAAVAPPAYLAP